MNTFDFETKPWFAILNNHGKRLIVLSEELYKREERLQSSYESYSFVVFPMAKAYEGFIKTYLHSVGILPRPGYSEYKFRIGRALNPDISEHRKNEWWLFDDLERACGLATARALWEAWIQCRNKIFHFYFDDEIPMPLPVAKKKILQISQAMDLAMSCLAENGK